MRIALKRAYADGTVAVEFVGQYWTPLWSGGVVCTTYPCALPDGGI